MCRCNPSVRAPYCDFCNNLMPQRSVVGTSLFDILEDGWNRQLRVFQAKEEAQLAGYVVTEGEVEIAFMIFDRQMIDSLEKPPHPYNNGRGEIT